MGIFGSKDDSKGVGATLYPDKILIETEDKVKDGFWIVTEHISMVSSKIQDEILGEMVRKHLGLSQTNVTNPKGQSAFKEIQIRNKMATGIKTEKDRMKDAKFVFVSLKNGILEFASTINGGTSGKKRGHHYQPEKSTSLASDCTNLRLGEELRNAWNKCV